MNWRDRIEHDPGALHGALCVRGTMIPVSVVLDNLAVHVDLREVLATYPLLSEEDVRACVAWAAACAHGDERAHGGGAVIDADFEGEPEASKVGTIPPACTDERSVRAEVRQSLFGALRGDLTIAEDFDAPLPEELLRDFEGGDGP